MADAALGAVGGDELGERVGVEQRHVAVDDEHVAVEVGRERVDGLLDGAAGAGDLVLVDDDALGQLRGDDLGDAVTLVAHDGDDVLRHRALRRWRARG